MKVQNTTIFMGDVLGNASRGERLSSNAQEKESRQSVFAGDLSKNFDPHCPEAAKRPQEDHENCRRCMGQRSDHNGRAGKCQNENGRKQESHGRGQFRNQVV